MPYLTKSEFSTTIEKLLSSFKDNNVKQYEKSKEIITKQDTNVDAKFEKQLHTSSPQIKEDNKKISSTLDEQDRKIYYFTISYNERLDKMGARTKVRTNIETAKTQLEATTNTKLDEFKNVTKSDNTTTFNYLGMKPPYLASNKPLSFLQTRFCLYDPMSTIQVT